MGQSGEGRWQRWWVAAAATLALAAPAWAQDAAAPPLPPPRPADLSPAQKTDGGPAPQGKVDAKEQAPPATAEKEGAEPDEACFSRLSTLGLTFEKKAGIREESCRVDNAVMVSGLADGVSVSPASLMTCATAESLARWTKDVVAPEATRHLKAKPAKVLIGTSYQCRNQRSGGKLSEHAFGNGLDVMGFAFEGRDPLSINSHEEGSPESLFQDAVRKGACPIFTTVLGPGSDEAHGDHLHVDMRARKGGYRICQ